MARTVVKHMRRNVVAYVALFFALGGTSYAVTKLPANSVDSRAIRAGAVGTSELRTRAVTADKVGKLPAVHAFTSQPAQPAPDGTFTAVRLAQEYFDIGGMHASGDEDTRVVAPRTGTYVVQGTAFYSGGTCGGPPRVALIQRTLRSGDKVEVDHANNDTLCSELTRVHAGGVVRLKQGEYVELLALQRGSGGVTVSGRLSAAFVGS